MTAWPPTIRKDVDYESNVDEKTVPDIFTHYNDTPSIISGVSRRHNIGISPYNLVNPSKPTPIASPS